MPAGSAHENSSPKPSAHGRRLGVVFMVPGFPENEEDTTCLPAIQNYVAALASLRPELEVHVIAFQYPYRRAEYAWNGVTVHALGGANRTGWRRTPTWLRAIFTFVGVRRRIDVRVLHSFWLTECTRVGAWLARAFGVRHVASVAGQDARDSNHYLRRLDLHRPIVTAGSSFAAALFAEHSGGATARVIPLGLDTGHLATIEPSARRDIDVIGVGSLIPLKDYDEFIDVVVALKSEFPHLGSCIVGDGPQRDALAQRIGRENLSDSVALVGHLPRDEAFRRMLRSRIFLHTSKYESQAYVFLEALFAGLDVVCYDVGYTGVSDHVHRCASVQEMVEACARLLKRPRQHARQPVPTVEDTVRAFARIYGI